MANPRKAGPSTVRNLLPTVNTQTGEVGDVYAVDEQPVRVVRSSKKPRREPFMMFTQRALRQLDLTGAQWRVLMLLGARRDRNTLESRMLVREMAAHFDIPDSNVSKTLGELQKRLIIFKLGVGIYRINTNIAYAGDNVVAQIAADPEPEWKRDHVPA